MIQLRRDCPSIHRPLSLLLANRCDGATSYAGARRAVTADLQGISRLLVPQAVSQGTIPSVRLGWRILIPKAHHQASLDGEVSLPDPERP